MKREEKIELLMTKYYVSLRAKSKHSQRNWSSAQFWNGKYGWLKLNSPSMNRNESNGRWTKRRTCGKEHCNIKCLAEASNVKFLAAQAFLLIGYPFYATNKVISFLLSSYFRMKSGGKVLWHVKRTPCDKWTWFILMDRRFYKWYICKMMQ